MINFKTSVLVAGVGLASLSARAAFTANDLYLGFSSSGATSDYLIDLGQPGVVGVGGSSVVNLTGLYSSGLFNATFTTGLTNVSMGVVGGNIPSHNIYATALRVGGPGDAAIAGSDLSGVAHNNTSISSSVSDLTTVAFPTAGNGTLDAGKTWTAHVNALATGSFYGDSGIDPNSTFDETGILYEDLWTATGSGAFNYLGYFTMDFSGESPALTFTPVPEPVTGGLFALGGICCFLFARKKNQKNT